MAKKRKDDRQVVVNSIVMQAPSRRVYDVGDWRTSLRAADTGRVKYLYDLFDDLLIDGVLSDAIDKRVQAVLNADLIFMDARGNEVDEMMELIDTSAWETLLRCIMEKLFFGRTAVEILVGDRFRVFPIKPKYVDLQHERILLDDGGMRSVSYVGDEQLLVLGRPDDFGLLLKAAPYAIWKRGGFGDYAQWIELFGMPQRIGKYNTFDPESRLLLEKAFKEAGSAPYVIAPKETEIEMLERNSDDGAGRARRPFAGHGAHGGRREQTCERSSVCAARAERTCAAYAAAARPGGCGRQVRLPEGCGAAVGG